jgi:hypothetical protein
MTLIHDPGAEARSLMMNAPCICNGEKTGYVCKHYWSVMQKFAANNADTMRDGEKQRACTLMAGWPLEFVSEEFPTKCNRYERRPMPGLFALVARAIGLAEHGWQKFDPTFEEFNPMTLQEIAALREKIPDPPPDPFQKGGKRPDRLSVDDIINGPQINIIKPGESIPGVTLSSDADKALDEIFAPKAEEPATPAAEPDAPAKKPRKPRAKKPEPEGK